MRGVLCPVLAAVALICAPVPGLAEGLLDKLFGVHREADPPPALLSPPPPQPSPQHPEPASIPKPVKYRTVCVRLCDGFYFPVSYAVTSSAFDRDERTCQSSCPRADVQLFRMPVGAEIGAARDRNGSAYSSLPNAYRYRQAISTACTCRPEPGSQPAEAVAAQEEATVVASDQPKPKPVPAVVAKRRIAAPRPVPAVAPPPSPPQGVVVAKGLFGKAQASPTVLDIKPAKGLLSW